MDRPLWVPSADRVERANLTRFRRFVHERTGVEAARYGRLHDWSVNTPVEFWPAVWDFAGISAVTRGDPVANDPLRMRPGAHYFPDARLNFAENLLRRSGSADAIVFGNERGRQRTWSFDQLRAEVAGFAGALRAIGVRPGDRIAGFLPNLPETIAAALGAASIGAVWSSCSPDFGAQGVLDRFGQITPRVLVTADGYFYGGKTFDSVSRVATVLEGLPTVERTVVVPYTGCSSLVPLRNADTWDAFVAPHRQAPLAFEPLPFNHPLYILYSSGTTGVPKCIVHGAGGTLHSAPQRAPAPLRHPGGRSRLLLHDVRLDDVELARVGAGLRCDPAAVRRIAVSSRRERAVRFRRRERDDALRHLREVHRRRRQGGPAPASDTPPRHRPDDDLHRVAAGVRELRVRLSRDKGGHPSGIHVWRHGHHQLFRRRRSDRARLEWRDPGPGPWHERRCLRRCGPFRPRCEKGELVCKTPFPSMPVAFWNDPDGREIPRCLLRALSGRVDARRLCRAARHTTASSSTAGRTRS